MDIEMIAASAVLFSIVTGMATFFLKPWDKKVTLKDVLKGASIPAVFVAMCWAESVVLRHIFH